METNRYIKQLEATIERLKEQIKEQHIRKDYVVPYKWSLEITLNSLGLSNKMETEYVCASADDLKTRLLEQVRKNIHISAKIINKTTFETKYKIIGTIYLSEGIENELSRE